MRQVDKLRSQAAEQAESLASQEADLASKKEQLEGLKQEERRLEQQRNDNLRQLEGLATNLQDTQLQISQVGLSTFASKNVVFPRSVCDDVSIRRRKRGEGAAAVFREHRLEWCAVWGLTIFELVNSALKLE